MRRHSIHWLQSTVCTEILTRGMESAFRVGKSGIKGRDLIFVLLIR